MTRRDPYQTAVFTIEADGMLLYVGPAFIESHIAALLRAF